MLFTAAGLSLLTGLVFGVVPALQLSRPDLTTALKDGARGASAGSASQRLRSTLVVVEIALAVVLVVGAALFIGSFRQIMAIDPGFDEENVLLVGVVPRLDRGVSTGDSLPDWGPQVQQVVDRLRQTPGVQYAGAISGGVPLGNSMSITTVAIPGRTLEPSDRQVSIRRVTADYHRALGIPLLAGRHVDDTDREGAAPVVVINDAAAKKFFAPEDAIGKSITLNSVSRTIVGVVGDVYQSSLELEPRTEVYVPMAQQRTVFSELVVRTSGDPYEVAGAVRAAGHAVMPGVLFRNIRSMEDVLWRVTAQRRLNMLLLGLFGVLGLVISTVGVYGVMAYVVSQRTREIGVRIALGASRRAVVSMVLSKAAVLVAAGLIVGATGAWFLSTVAESFLFRMDVHDPRPFLAALATLGGAALLASVIPARRAAGVDPMVALRSE